ncbi:MAG: PD-(D/E)XK nuclease family protein [Planctomycetes bacterium]|nr:PD-(D/E)XK nuclease family protein [Planctomycetota bacterium]
MIAGVGDTTDKRRSVLRDPPSDTKHVAAPNDFAEALIGRSYISWSSIGTYMRCPMRFRLQYVLGQRPESVSSSLIFGSAIHSALEEHFACLFTGTAAPSLDELLVVYDRVWREETQPVRFGKTETPESLRDLAGRVLTAFQSHDVAALDRSCRLIGVEEELRGAIIDGVPDVLGRIDLMILTETSLRIIDFKTSRSAWSASKITEAAPQQLLYSQLARPIADAFGVPIEIEWIVLTKAKQPKVERHTLTPDPASIRRTNGMVRDVWRAICGEYFHINPSVMNCSTCPHKTTCAALEG